MFELGTPRRTGRESVLYCELQASKQALAHHLAWGTLQCCKNATRENAYHEKTHTF